MAMTTVNATHDDFDIYNIKGSFTERFFMGLWCAVTSTMAIIGNSTVLVATLKYNAIKLDKISTLIIQNIALADFGYSMYIISTMVSIIYDEWVFGEILCFVTNYMHFFFGITEIYLICAFNISKLHCLLFPLQARSRSVQSGRIIVIAMWCVMPVFHLIPTLLLDRIVSFRHTFYSCIGYFVLDDPNKSYLFPFFAAIAFVVLPFIIVLISIIWLLHKVRGVIGLQKQSIVTLLLISLCYFCSFLPYAIYNILKVVFTGMQNNLAFAVHFHRFSLFMCYLNFSANPFIYIFSVKSFKTFLASSLVAQRKRFCDKMIFLGLKTSEANTTLEKNSAQTRTSSASARTSNFINK